MLDALLAKFYKYIILFLLIVTLAFTWYTNHLAGKLNKAEYLKTLAVQAAIKPYQDAIIQAEAAKHTTEQAWYQRYIKVEQNALKKIQDANTAARDSHMAIDRLSKQTAEADKRLSSHSRETIIDYGTTCNIILNDLAERGGEIAQKADGHAIDVERLSSSWPNSEIGE